VRFKALSYWGHFDGLRPGAEDGEEVHGIIAKDIDDS